MGLNFADRFDEWGGVSPLWGRESQLYMVSTTGPALTELSPRIVNTSGYIAFLFHIVVQGRACSLIIFTHYINALQACARVINCTTKCIALFSFKRERDYKQAPYYPQECAPGHLRGNQNSAPRALFSGVSRYVVLFDWLFETIVFYVVPLLPNKCLNCMVLYDIVEQILLTMFWGGVRVEHTCDLWVFQNVHLSQCVQRRRRHTSE